MGQLLILLESGKLLNKHARGWEAAYSDYRVVSNVVLGGAGDLVSKVISRVIFGVTPFRVLITRLITYLLSPLLTKSPAPPSWVLGFRSGISKGSFKGSIRV